MKIAIFFAGVLNHFTENTIHVNAIHQKNAMLVHVNFNFEAWLMTWQNFDRKKNKNKVNLMDSEQIRDFYDWKTLDMFINTCTLAFTYTAV